MKRPDIVALAAWVQKELRQQDWRVVVRYVRDLKSDAGADVYGLCLRNDDAREAIISIRDPETPPPGTPDPDYVSKTVIHEVAHLLFAGITTGDPAAQTREENAVWAIEEALWRAWRSPAEQVFARQIIARYRALSRPGKGPPGQRRSRMVTAELKQKALDAIEAGDLEAMKEILKALLVGADEESPPMSADPTDQNQDPQMAKQDDPNAAPPQRAAARMSVWETRLRAATLDAEAAAKVTRSGAIETMISTAATRGISLPDGVAKRLRSAPSVADAKAILDVAIEMVDTRQPAPATRGNVTPIARARSSAQPRPLNTVAQIPASMARVIAAMPEHMREEAEAEAAAILAAKGGAK